MKMQYTAEKDARQADVFRAVLTRILVFVLLILAGTGLFSLRAEAMTGTGTAEDPYLIADAGDWADFAEDVSEGNSAGKVYQLADSFDSSEAVAVPVGSGESPFEGVFDGNGKMVRVNIVAPETSGAALFNVIRGAEIRNLTVTGTVDGGIHSAGLAGYSDGSGNLISNCTVNVAVSNRGSSGSGYIGGVVGHAKNSTLTISDTVFSGSLSNNGEYAGGIQGWADGNTLTLTNCLFRGSYSGDGYFHPIAVQDIYYNSTVTVHGAYYTAEPTYINPSYVAAAGMQVYLSAPAGEVYLRKTVRGSSFYLQVEVTGIDPVYAYTGNEIAVAPELSIEGTELTQGTDYSFSVNPSSVREEGSYSLLITGRGSFSGSKSVDFKVIRQLAGQGTAEAPWQIGSAGDWAVFAGSVDAGMTYSGQYIRLDANISVTQPVGSDGNRFKGRFNGDGHTLTFNYTAAEEYAAPFSYAESASFSNLTITGNIRTSQKYSAGLIGRAYGNCTVTDCVSSVTIDSQMVGDGTHSGFVGINEGEAEITLRNCVFRGSLLGPDTNKCGGFVGWNAGFAHFHNCLFAPSRITVSEEGSAAFSRGDTGYAYSYIFEFDDCFRLADFGLEQGLHALTEMPEEFCKKQQMADGNEYWYTAETGIENVEDAYPWTGSVIPVAPAVIFNGKALEETDFTVSTDPEEVKGIGEYTLTVTGAGDYHGGLSCTFRVVSSLQGSGTQEDPWRIRSVADWLVFRASVESGVTYSGQYVRLENNVTVTEMVGSEENPFKGVFDGNGKTLTFNCAVTEQYAGPFRYIENAQILNLSAAGTITTGEKYAGGLVGRTSGDCIISHCTSRVTINSTVEGDGTHGGFVGHNREYLAFSDCVFAGKLLGTNTYKCAGFVGWSDDYLSFSDCLFAPAKITVGETGSAVFVRGGNTSTNDINAGFDNSHYLTSFGTPQGTQAFDTVQEAFCKKAVLADGNTYWYVAEALIGNVEEAYPWAGAVIPVEPAVTFDGTDLAAGTDYTVSTVPAEVKDVGEYTLTVTGKGDYAGTASCSFRVVGSLPGTGASNNPWQIGSSEDWAVFAASIENGISYSGQHIRLTADITVGEMAGSEANPFKGTFDGNGKTLTFNYTAEEQYAAPFRYAKDASFMNLTVAGTITTSAKYAGGLVARALGDCRFTGCVSRVTINSSVGGDGTHGGFIAHSAADARFTNCVFSGKLLGAGTDSCAGFVGWSSEPLSFSNCLCAPTQITVGDNQSAVFVRGGEIAQNNVNASFSSSWYLTDFGTPQGEKVSADRPEDVFCKEVRAADGHDYYLSREVTATGLAASYPSTGEAIMPDPTVWFGETELRENTDYTLAVSPAPAQEPGDYTLTVTGTGKYYGTKAFSFRVTRGQGTLTVIAQACTITYGEEPRANGVIYMGFDDGDDETCLGGALDYDFEYVQYGDVGVYTITPRGLASDDYLIEYRTGSLTVAPKEVSLAWTDLAFTYNGSLQEPVATAEGLVNGDECTVTVTGGQKDAGENLTATAVSLSNGNYKLPADRSVEFSIARAAQDAPAAPEAESVNANSIRLKAVSGAEYRRGSGEWQTSPLFTGLEKNTEYTFVQRMAEDGNHFVSAESDSTAISTSGEHIHAWEYSAEGAVITAECANTDGGHEGVLTATLTITAPALKVYGSTESELAAVTGSIEGVDIPPVRYAEGTKQLNGAPTSAGTYTASITLGEATASVQYTIAKTPAPVDTAPAALEGLSFTGDAMPLISAGTASVNGMNYALGADAETAPADGWTKNIPTGVEAGTYYVWYKALGDANHDESVPLCVTVTIAPSGGQQGGGQDDPGTGEDPTVTQPPVTPAPAGPVEKVTLSKLKSVKLKALSAKKIEVKWKKLSKKDQKKIQKIQIEYSTDKTFKTGVKTKWAKKGKASYTIKGLKKNTKYWVRIRAYKKDGNTIHVSKWITKSKKTKKK